MTMSTSQSHSNESAPLPVALLVLDMQPAFLKVIDAAEPLFRRTQFAIGAARLLGIEVIFTEQVPGKMGVTDEFLTSLAPGARVFQKTAFSALGAEGLEDHLRNRGIDHLLIAGIETPICVYQTATAALRSEFDVTLLSDAIGCRRREDGVAVLASLREAGAHILPAESVFYSILQDATDPRFREFTALVKAGG